MQYIGLTNSVRSGTRFHDSLLPLLAPSSLNSCHRLQKHEPHSNARDISRGDPVSVCMSCADSEGWSQGTHCSCLEVILWCLAQNDYSYTTLLFFLAVLLRWDGADHRSLLDLLLSVFMVYYPFLNYLLITLLVRCWYIYITRLNTHFIPVCPLLPFLLLIP